MKYTVLVVEDEFEQRRAIIERVDWQSAGFEVVGEAENGVEALDLIETLEPDLILTDIKMPRMDGFDLLHNMRHTESLKHIPVIVVSSVYEKDMETQVKKLGAQGYIVKSDFERENLIAKARELLADG